MITVIKHPLVQHKLFLMRDKNTGTKNFRELTYEISQMLGYEAMRDLPLKLYDVETPITLTQSPDIASNKKLALISILRAGLAMSDAIANLVPAAKIGHIGMYRDHATYQAVEYFCKLPNDIPEREIFLLDPMLATGSSAIAAIELLKNRGAAKITFVCIIAAPEGVQALQKQHPDVQRA